MITCQFPSVPIDTIFPGEFHPLIDWGWNSGCGHLNLERRAEVLWKNLTFVLVIGVLWTWFLYSEGSITVSQVPEECQGVAGPRQSVQAGWQQPSKAEIKELQLFLDCELFGAAVVYSPEVQRGARVQQVSGVDLDTAGWPFGFICKDTLVPEMSLKCVELVGVSLQGGHEDAPFRVATKTELKNGNR